MTPQALTSFLHQKIPITVAMGVEVISFDAQSISLKAPLAKNHNHMGTAFGGSLSTLMILSCYSWFFNELQSENPDIHIVIKDGQTKYLAPVKGDLTAICERPAEDAIQEFLKSYEKKNIGRIELKSYIPSPDGTPACQFKGLFVAKK